MPNILASKLDLRDFALCNAANKDYCNSRVFFHGFQTSWGIKTRNQTAIARLDTECAPLPAGWCGQRP
jgi:hypothetical protein